MNKHYKPIAIAVVATVSGLVLVSIVTSLFLGSMRHKAINPVFAKASRPAPLVMKGGDPYVRALMRMISASESNDARPYSVLYGGTHIDDLSHHPQKCIRIVNGPNLNNCSTAAGRYQMINTTWAKMAERYHPNPDGFLWVKTGYGFEPEYQDAVVHAWLSDEKFWGMNIPQLLKDGELDRVRKRLSSTWTSLGYGIETNTMTPALTGIYAKLIKEELAQQR
jgi:muramidase (phage lysozyme)